MDMVIMTKISTIPLATNNKIWVLECIKKNISMIVDTSYQKENHGLLTVFLLVFNYFL